MTSTIDQASSEPRPGAHANRSRGSDQAATKRRRKKNARHAAVIGVLTLWTIFALAPIVWILMM